MKIMNILNSENKSGLLPLRILGIFFLLFAIVFYIILFFKVVNLVN